MKLLPVAVCVGQAVPCPQLRPVVPTEARGQCPGHGLPPEANHAGIGRRARLTGAQRRERRATVRVAGGLRLSVGAASGPPLLLRRLLRDLRIAASVVAPRQRSIGWSNT